MIAIISQTMHIIKRMEAPIPNVHTNAITINRQVRRKTQIDMPFTFLLVFIRWLYCQLYLYYLSIHLFRRRKSTRPSRENPRYKRKIKIKGLNKNDYCCSFGDLLKSVMELLTSTTASTSSSRIISLTSSDKEPGQQKTVIFLGKGSKTE